MKALDAVKGFGTATVGVLSSVASAVAILGYVGIGPAQAATGATLAFMTAAPLITFVCGAIAGWGFTRQRSNAEMKKSSEAHADELDALRKEHADELAALKKEHAAELAHANEECESKVARLDKAHAKELSDLSDELSAERERASALESELGERPTREEMDEAASEIERLKKAGEEPPVLKGDDALSFIASLAENQRETLRDIYDNGGSIEADPLDGELQALKGWGLVSIPGLFSPGMPCTWTLPPNVNAIIRDHPEILDGGSPEDREKLAMAKGFSRGKARAVMRAFESDGLADVDEDELEIIGSVQAREGIFLLETIAVMGMSRTGTHYKITDEWRAFLKRDGNLEKFKEAVFGAGGTKSDIPVGELSPQQRCLLRTCLAAEERGRRGVKSSKRNAGAEELVGMGLLDRSEDYSFDENEEKVHWLSLTMRGRAVARSCERDG